MAQPKPSKFKAIKKPKLNLKISVAIALFITFVGFTAILVAGLFVPKSVLVKLSQDKQSATEFVASSDQPVTDTATNQTDTAQDSTQTATTSSNGTTTTTTTTSTNSTAPASTTGSTGTAPSGGTSTPPTSGATGATGVAPVLTFSGSPTTITVGASSVLSWSINNTASPAPTCTAGGGWSGAKATSGSQTVTPASTTTYTLVCSNSAGSSGTKSVGITVNAAVAACGSLNGACTTAEVLAHNTRADCWVIYAGSYYILSGSKLPSGRATYASNTHPGGSGAFTSTTCGHDITAYMNGSTNAGTSIAAHNHSGSAYTTLASYKVGAIK